MASLAFISKELGVSKATVSRAFDPRFSGMVREETKKRIFEFCREHNYHPSIIGRSFSTGKTFKIGLIAADSDEKHFTLFTNVFFRTITESAIKRNYTPILLRPDKKAGSHLNLINCSIADAYVINNFRLDEKLFELLEQKKIPAIIHDPYNNAAGRLPTFYRDIRPAFRKLWQNLPEKYHAKTAFVWRGYVPGKWQDLQASAPDGITVDSIQISDRQENFLFHRDSARAGTEKMLEQILKYKLLWCSSDLVALGVCDTLRAHGIVPGKDIYVVGFDNLEGNMNDFSSGGLTTIDPGWEPGGRTLVNMLLDSLDSNSPLPFRTPYFPEVIYRETFPQQKQ